MLKTEHANLSDDNLDPEENDGNKYLISKNSHRFLERYFQPGYLLELCNIPYNDLCVLIHSNRVCVVTLAKSHHIFRNKLEVTKVDFQTGPNINRLKNQVHGKTKKGGQFLNTPTDPICRLECSDGSVHIISCGVRGKLLEINRRLVTLPSLLFTHTLTEGYLAAIQPKLNEMQKTYDSLIPYEQYKKSRTEEFVT